MNDRRQDCRSIRQRSRGPSQRATTARKAKNLQRATASATSWLAKGIVLKDGPQGTTWEVKR